MDHLSPDIIRERIIRNMNNYIAYLNNSNDAVYGIPVSFDEVDMELFNAINAQKDRNIMIIDEQQIAELNHQLKIMTSAGISIDQVLDAGKQFLAGKESDLNEISNDISKFLEDIGMNIEDALNNLEEFVNQYNATHEEKITMDIAQLHLQRMQEHLMGKEPEIERTNGNGTKTVPIPYEYRADKVYKDPIDKLESLKKAAKKDYENVFVLTRNINGKNENVTSPYYHEALRSFIGHLNKKYDNPEISEKIRKPVCSFFENNGNFFIAVNNSQKELIKLEIQSYLYAIEKLPQEVKYPILKDMDPELERVFSSNSGNKEKRLFADKYLSSVVNTKDANKDSFVQYLKKEMLVQGLNNEYYKSTLDNIKEILNGNVTEKVSINPYDLSVPQKTLNDKLDSLTRRATTNAPELDKNKDAWGQDDIDDEMETPWKQYEQ